jgi:peptidoglycan-associated lipoprotein
MVRQVHRIALMLLVAAAPVVAGCAKATTTSDGSSATAEGSMSGRAGAAGAGRSGHYASMGGDAAGSATRPDPREFVVAVELHDIHFDFDRYDIRPEDASVLDANAQSLKANPSWLVLIEGHTDERGTVEYNLALGERRARASLNYLVAQGVRSNRISIISYGKERPTCGGADESCWSQNRRAHFLIKKR